MAVRRRYHSLLPLLNSRALQVDIDLGGVEQLVETSQTRAVADALDMLARGAMARKLPVKVTQRPAEHLLFVFPPKTGWRSLPCLEFASF